MFSLSNTKAIDDNPALAQALVKNISLFDLMELAKQSDDGRRSIIDKKCIIDGVMESKDEGKILFLASSSSLLDFGSDDSVFEKIFDMGDDFRISLYGNRRVDWYGIVIFHWHKYIHKILDDVVRGEEKFKIPFYKNPRMDRRIIASIIGAKNYLNKDFRIEFELLNFKERYYAFSKSYNVSEILSESYIGKDMPDDNEMYFSKPFDANLRFIRDLVLHYNEKDASIFLRTAYFYLDDTKFDIDPDDWISSSEMAEFENQNTDTTNKYEIQQQLAFSNILMFFDRNTQDISPVFPNGTKPDFEDYKYFSRSTSAIVIIDKLMNGYWLKDKIIPYLKILLKSENWIMRAAGYRFLFQNINVTKNPKLLDKFFEFYRIDKYAFLHAIFHSSRTRLLDRARVWQRDLITDFLESSNIDNLTKKYLSETTNFAFGFEIKQMNSDEFDAHFNKIMRSTNNEIAEAVLLKNDIDETSEISKKKKMFGSIFGG